MCGKLAEIAFASKTSLRHTRCTRVPLPTLRRHKTSASLLAFVGGRLHTRHTAHESYAYRLLRQKKTYNSEEARARDEGDGTVQIRDLEPTTALSFGQGQRSSVHCIRAVSDPQRFSPPKQPTSVDVTAAGRDGFANRCMQGYGGPWHTRVHATPQGLRTNL